MGEKFVLVVEWKRSGVRSFIGIPHGGLPFHTYFLRSAYRGSEDFLRGLATKWTYKNLDLFSRITSWKVMTVEEAEAWVKSWPWEEWNSRERNDGLPVIPNETVWPAEIPYWSTDHLDSTLKKYEPKGDENVER